MRAKKSKQKTREKSRCNSCNKEFSTVGYLNAHRIRFHGPVTKKSLKSKSATNRSVSVLVGFRNPLSIARKLQSKSSNDLKSVVKNEKVKASPSVSEIHSMAPNSSADGKLKFECPECNKLFPAYFSAHRHILKSHCVNIKGEAVPPSSPDLIKPTRIETCKSCLTTIKSTQVHHCNSELNPKETLYLCSGCKQGFNNLKLFDIHVKGIHCDGVENLFLPTYAEFVSWKQQTEIQTKSTFLMMNKCNSKQFYRCNYSAKSDDDNVTTFCPATIITEEFVKGIQVNFYKQHFGHTTKPYTTNAMFNKYCITSFFGSLDGNYDDITSVETDEKDLYVQFKTLMESLVVNAAKVRVDTLRSLMEKALEMTSIFMNYEEDIDISLKRDSDILETSKKNLTEKQIVKALEDMKNIQENQKHNPVKVNNKIIPSNNDENDTIEEDSLLVPIKRQRKSVLLQNETNTALKSNNNNINKIQTSKSLPVKGVETPVKRDVKQVTTNENGIKEAKITPNILKRGRSIEQSPSSFNDSYKEFVDKHIKPGNVTNKLKLKEPLNAKHSPKPVPAGKSSPQSIVTTSKVNSVTPDPSPTKVKQKKLVLRTKLGQYSPKAKPQIIENKIKDISKIKDYSPKERPLGSPQIIENKIKDISKIKVEKYEIKERENDCNILILKI